MKPKFRLTKLIPVLLLVMTLGIILSIVVKTNHHEAIFTANITKESSEALNNPYCGWYHIYSYTLGDNKVGPIEKMAEKNVRERDENRLALLEINIGAYREDELTNDGIDELDLILAIWSETDVQLILRFVYDWDGNAAASEPENFYLIQTHMVQIAEVVNDYASSVYMVQGTFTGDYGEMHDSNYQDDEYISTLFRTMLQQFNSRIYLAVRTPAYRRLVIGSEEPGTIYDSMNRTATGVTALYNDGILGSETDMGTYAEEGESVDLEELSQKRYRGEEIAYQEEHCLFVPNGGEVIVESELNDFENANYDFSKMHISYLNQDYDTDVINKWKENKYDIDDPYFGLTEYEYITRHLGYRYVLRGASYFPPDSFFGQDATLTLRVENVGYSNCYEDLTLSIKAIDKSTGEGFILPSTTNTNPRFWNAGQINLVNISLPMDHFQEDHTYTLYACVSDATTNEPISFANEGDSSYDCVIGTLSISSAWSFAK